MKRLLRALPSKAIAALVACTGAALGQVTFTNFGPSTPAYGMDPGVVSNDGSVIAMGCGGCEAYRWTAAGGFEDLGTMTGGSSAYVHGISADGSTVVGEGTVVEDGMLHIHAFRWTAAAGMQDLGKPFGIDVVAAWGASADGSVVVGAGYTTCCNNFAYRWTAAQGFESVPATVEGWGDTTASGVSADGTVIVGNGWAPGAYYRAWRWTALGGTQDLGMLATGGVFSSSSAAAVSADGSTVVGASSLDDPSGTPGAQWHPMRWTAAAGMQDLGTLPGDNGVFVNISSAFGVSGDGSIIVGSANAGDPLAGTHAFLWTESLGMVDLNTFLPTLGVDLTGWDLISANSISADGSTILGRGYAPPGSGGNWVLHFSGGIGPSPWSNLGSGLAGVDGIPQLSGSGTLVASSTGSLELASARPSSPADLFVSLSSIPSPFKGGVLVTVPVAFAVYLATDTSGSVAFPFTWPSGITAATSLYLQFAIQDAAAPKGVALSNALSAVTP